MISIIIITYNEEAGIEKTLLNIQELPYPGKKEIIIADGGSTDQTVSIAGNYGKVVNSPKGKALQMNRAAQNSNGEILFFVHADMQFPKDTLLAIYSHIYEKGYDGGGFSNVFDQQNKKIKDLGTLLNFRFLNKREQSDRKIFYGDNGIFVKRSVFLALGGFKEIPIMEDYDFSIRMRNQYRVQKVTQPKLILSSRRHLKAGFLKTRLQWIIIKKLYLLGISPNWLASLYRDVR